MFLQLLSLILIFKIGTVSGIASMAHTILFLRQIRKQLPASYFFQELDCFSRKFPFLSDSSIHFDPINGSQLISDWERILGKVTEVFEFLLYPNCRERR